MDFALQGEYVTRKQLEATRQMLMKYARLVSYMPQRPDNGGYSGWRLNLRARRFAQGYLAWMESCGPDINNEDVDAEAFMNELGDILWTVFGSVGFTFYEDEDSYDGLGSFERRLEKAEELLKLFDPMISHFETWIKNVVRDKRSDKINFDSVESRIDDLIDILSVVREAILASPYYLKGGEYRDRLDRFIAESEDFIIKRYKELVDDYAGVFLALEGGKR